MASGLNDCGSKRLGWLLCRIGYQQAASGMQGRPPAMNAKKVCITITIIREIFGAKNFLIVAKEYKN